MDEEKPGRRPAPKSVRTARDKRILERLRDGYAPSEIARDEKLSARRVRQIVKEALEGRQALEKAVHAHVQLDRVAHAMRAARDALAGGDVRAIAPFLKAVEKLDHYQALAREAAPAIRLGDNERLVLQEVYRRFGTSALSGGGADEPNGPAKSC